MDPSDAEEKIKYPPTTNIIVRSKNIGSTFFREPGDICNTYYPKIAIMVPNNPKITERTQYLIVTLYDGQPIASK